MHILVRVGGFLVRQRRQRLLNLNDIALLLGIVAIGLRRSLRRPNMRRGRTIDFMATIHTRLQRRVQLSIRNRQVRNRDGCRLAVTLAHLELINWKIDALPLLATLIIATGAAARGVRAHPIDLPIIRPFQVLLITFMVHVYLRSDRAKLNCIGAI